MFDISPDELGWVIALIVGLVFVGAVAALGLWMRK